MATNVGHNSNMDRYVVIHVATTCDEHGVYVTKDSAEVIELGWMLLNAQTLEEVFSLHVSTPLSATNKLGLRSPPPMLIIGDAL